MTDTRTAAQIAFDDRLLILRALIADATRQQTAASIAAQQPFARRFLAGLAN